MVDDGKDEFMVDGGGGGGDGWSIGEGLTKGMTEAVELKTQL